MANVSLPAIVSQLPNDVRNFLQRVRELLVDLDTRSTVTTGGTTTTIIVGGGGDGSEPDYTQPPAPTGLTASGSITTVFLQWDDVSATYDNLSHTEIWRSATNNLGTAVLNGTAQGHIYQDAVDPMSTYYYWVRMVSLANVDGPFNAVEGVAGVTSQDPASVVDLLTAHGLYTDTPYYYQAEEATINGVVVPTGTYISSAFIANGSITTAKIGNAQITNAKIESLTASKLTAGTITGQDITVGVGGNIKSGQTAYNTGTGWWIGKGSDGYSRFSVGNPTGSGFDWSEETGVMNFRGRMELVAGSTIGGVSSENIAGWQTPPFICSDFTNGTLNGWSAAGVNVSVSPSINGMIYTWDGPGSGYLVSPALNMQGRTYTKIIMTIKWISGDGVWLGNCYPSTTVHGAEGSQWVKHIDKPEELEVGGDYVTLIWDMENLTIGGSDWINSTITYVWFTLANQNNVFNISSIYIMSNQIDSVNIRADSSIITGNTVPVAGSKYSVLSGGDLSFYDYVDSGWVPYKSVTKTITLTCDTGTTVPIGYFRDKPTVILSPFLIDSYRGAYPNQDQTLHLYASNIRETSSGSKSWQFDAVANLILRDGYASGGGTPWSYAYLPEVELGENAWNTPKTVGTYSVQAVTSQLTLASNTRSVNVSIKIFRQYYKDFVKGLFEEYCYILHITGHIRVRADITLHYYLNRYGWYTTITSIDNIPGQGVYDTVTLGASSGADILYVYADAVFSIYDSTPVQELSRSCQSVLDQLFTSMKTQGIQIVSTSSTLTGQTISIYGKATCMAIG